MRRRWLMLLVALGIACSKQTPKEMSEADWYLIETPNIRLETNLPLRHARARATAFENDLQVLIYLYQLLSPRPPPALRPTRVVLFEGCSAYATAVGSEDTVGMARPSRDLNDALVVVTCDDPLQPFKLSHLVRNTLFRHELSHALNAYYFGALPTWLDEGLAEYFAGVELRAGNAELGHPPIDKLLAPSSKRIALDTLRSRPWEIELGNYRAAWRVTHALLNTSTASRDCTQRYLQRLAAGAREAAAWREAMAPVDAEVRTTYDDVSDQGGYKIWTVPLAVPAAIEVRSRPMSHVEIAARLVDLAIPDKAGRSPPRLREALANLERIDREGHAARLWRALAAYHVGDPSLGDPAVLFADYARNNPADPRGRLGWLLGALAAATAATTEAGRRRSLAPVEEFLPAIVEAARSPLELTALANYWILADKPAIAIPFLRRALTLEPACSRCYEALAASRFAQKQYAEAVEAQEHAIGTRGDRPGRPEMQRVLRRYREAAAASQAASAETAGATKPQGPAAPAEAAEPQGPATPAESRPR